MNYTFNQLRIFLKIVQTTSITKAADELHLTQPAVSIQLKNFQNQFDISLTETIGRKLFITDFGLEVAKTAENILSEVNAINYKTLAHKGQLSGKLKISVVSTGKYVMPYFLSGFLKKHHGVDLQMDVTNKMSVIKSLENNEVDFALVSILPEKLKIEKLDLIQNKLYLVGNSEIKSRKHLQTKEIFEDIKLIYREKGSGTRLTMERFLKKNHINVSHKFELTSNEAVKQAVLASLGYSIMPLLGIQNELHLHQLQLISVKGLPVKTTWSLIWLKDKRHSIAASSYLDFLKKEKNKIIEKDFKWNDDY